MEYDEDSLTARAGPRNLAEAVDRFLTTGDPKPEGVRSLGRWFRTDMQGGYHLLEAENATAIAQYSVRWADLLELETSAVIEDAEAVSVMGEIAGVTAKAGGAVAGRS
ncbi:MAG: DUF3303 domain-containing protein [Acidobacteriota bacterium]|nr:DUF3303 domain-containing protein [Acidobacteriota bacterium]